MNTQTAQPTAGPLKVDHSEAVVLAIDANFRVYSETTQGNVAYFYSEADAKRFAAHDALVQALTWAIELAEERIADGEERLAGDSISPVAHQRAREYWAAERKTLGKNKAMLAVLAAEVQP